MLTCPTQRGGETGITSRDQQQALAAMKFAGPTIIFVFGTWLPALTQILLVSGVSIGYVQNRLFTNSAFRQFVGIHPLPSKIRQSSAEYTGVISRYQPPAAEKEGIMNMWRKIVKKGQDYMSTRQGTAPRLNKREKSEAEQYERRRRQQIEEEIVKREQEGRRR